MEKYDFYDRFVNRHIGPSESNIEDMLNEINATSLDELVDQTIPKHIRLKEELPYADPMTEHEFLNFIRETASNNIIAKNYLGMGYNETITPAVIQRNILENPGWYTQYTPYQAEISQGRLEALINFQTMIIDLTGLPVANASLLDEATAAAEAMLLLFANTKRKNADKFLVDENVFPQTLDVLLGRAEPKNIIIESTPFDSMELTESVFGIIVQYPNSIGEINDYSSLIAEAHEKDIQVIMIADILSLTLLTPPGEFGADIAVGSTQRFGVPMSFGGPHAAYLAVSDKYKRVIPGRIIGSTIDAKGNLAYRMALQTREQHIRREKATSNICTAQVLLSIMSSMYAIYHGAEGLKEIAKRIHFLTALLEKSLIKLGFIQFNKSYFDTLLFELTESDFATISDLAEDRLMNFIFVEYYHTISISIGETATAEDIYDIVTVFADAIGAEVSFEEFIVLAEEVEVKIPKNLERTSKFLTHPVFSSYRSETDFMRYVKKLESRDLSLTRSMISLGSCTMKLNAAAEMLSITNPNFANIHPFAPDSQIDGYYMVIEMLEKALSEITGLPGVSLQPNSGAQGEYAGLMVIRAYLKDIGQGERDTVLIPSSAHGTNPASAVMAGLKLIIVNCDEKGNIDVEDLRSKADANRYNLAALMVTYPSTHGVFEEEIIDICEIIHQNGGQVYMDGANMNAQVGLTSPAAIGADVCHLNLHKTFAIPHGGGGPGVGPICVAKHLVPYLPGHVSLEEEDDRAIPAISAAPFGSAGVLIISLGYILMLGSEGLKRATQVAILNANYIKAKLEPYYKVLYTGKHGRVAHELIFDAREFKKTAGIEVEDIAKRLMDYGFHAPTISFPVAGTFMVEPTESESKAELDRFIGALISIRNEIAEIERGEAQKTNNVLKNAPHTMFMIMNSEWDYPYSREKAAFPADFVRDNKFWPHVTRVNNALGDRNLVCSCS